MALNKSMLSSCTRLSTSMSMSFSFSPMLRYGSWDQPDTCAPPSAYVLFCIDFAGVQIPRCLHRRAQFFNIVVCSVGRIDFSQQKVCGNFKCFCNTDQMFRTDLIGFAAHKPVDRALVAANAGRQLRLNDFVLCIR